MGKIFYIMGKSASGKDTIYKELMEKMPKFHSIVPYTTRPMREGEKDGVEYFFVDQERFDEMMDEEKIIEFRSYNTKCGIWTYFTADDGQIELWQYDYLVINDTVENAVDQIETIIRAESNRVCRNKDFIGSYLDSGTKDISEN